MDNKKTVEQIIEEQIILCEKLEDSHPDVDEELNKVCELLEKNSKAKECIPHYERILSIRRKKYGDNHEMTANCANNMAGAYVQTGDFETAARYMSRALEIYIDTLGKEHETTVIAAKNMLFLQSVLQKEDDDEVII